jgi:hypothetical protein
MPSPSLLPLALMIVALVPLGSSMSPASHSAQQPPQVAIPQSGVPQIMTIEGNFVRAAYNNEGYAILGYKLANLSLGEEWMLLEFGATVRDDVPNYTLRREALSLETPDGKTIPLATKEEYLKADVRALLNREKVQRDSINYFPPMATRACRIGFFAELDSRAMAYDQVELSNMSACLGRLFFHIPTGIQYGQHWLNVKFEKSIVRVPFRILTKEEEKLLSRNYGDIRRQVQEAFKPKKKG